MSLLSLAQTEARRDAPPVIPGTDSPAPSDDEEKWKNQLLRLFPSEAVAALTTATAFCVGFDARFWPWRWICFIAVAVLVPFWVYFGYWDTLTDAQKRAKKLPIPYWAIAIGVLGYLAWAVTIPGNALLDWHVWNLKWAPAVTFAAALLLTVADHIHAIWKQRSSAT